MSVYIKTNKMLKPILTTLPSTVIQSVILAFIMTNDLRYLYFLIPMFSQELLNKGLKKIFNKPRPNSSGGILTVLKSGNEVPYGCHVYPTGTYSVSSGMPSGHAQTSWFAATFWILFLMGKNRSQWVSMSLLMLLATAVCVQRVHAKCHSLSQVIVGGLFGILFGIISYLLCNKFLGEKYFPYPFDDKIKKKKK
jgi:membrane-associated phospholipid phosphatase